MTKDSWLNGKNWQEHAAIKHLIDLQEQKYSYLVDFHYDMQKL